MFTLKMFHIIINNVLRFICKIEANEKTGFVYIKIETPKGLLVTSSTIDTDNSFSITDGWYADYHKAVVTAVDRHLRVTKTLEDLERIFKDVPSQATIQLEKEEFGVAKTLEDK